MRTTIHCKHYRAMSNHQTCSAGVEYAQFKGLPWEQRPCFCTPPSPPPGGCELAEFPTTEEMAAKEAKIEARIASIGKARQAIVTHLGGPWKRGIPSVAGVIDCPVCQGQKSLRFSRAGYNGHIHAACSTHGCVSWME